MVLAVRRGLQVLVRTVLRMLMVRRSSRQSALGIFSTRRTSTFSTGSHS